MQLRHLLRFALAALEQRRRQQRAGWRSGQRRRLRGRSSVRAAAAALPQQLLCPNTPAAALLQSCKSRVMADGARCGPKQLQGGLNCCSRSQQRSVALGADGHGSGAGNRAPPTDRAGVHAHARDTFFPLIGSANAAPRRWLYMCAHRKRSSEMPMQSVGGSKFEGTGPCSSTGVDDLEGRGL